jgi:hypothetical protein
VVDHIGPFALLNAVAGPAGGFAPAIILRARVHLDFSRRVVDLSKTDLGTYHGGWVDDEIAALICLVSGGRCRGGGVVRQFEPGDLIGTPYEFGRRTPYLPTLPPATARVMPHIATTIDLAGTKEWLERYQRIADEDDATALLRSARLYQQALWMTEEDAPSSFVDLVSAVETAAGRWSAAEHPDPVTELDFAMPALAQTIRKRSDDAELLRAVATRLSRITGSSSKFRRFLTAFDPGPPSPRTSETANHVEWAALDAHCRRIYDWRSLALHGGVPVPRPIYESPRELPEELGTWSERPTGNATATLEAVWVSAETPMLVWVFAHLVRGALLNWWSALPLSPG